MGQLRGSDMNHYRDMNLEERVKRLERILDEVILKIEFDSTGNDDADDDKIFDRDIVKWENETAICGVEIIFDEQKNVLDTHRYIFSRLHAPGEEFIENWKHFKTISSEMTYGKQGGFLIETVVRLLADRTPKAENIWQLNKFPDKTHEVTPRQGIEKESCKHRVLGYTWGEPGSAIIIEKLWGISLEQAQKGRVKFFEFCPECGERIFDYKGLMPHNEGHKDLIEQRIKGISSPEDHAGIDSFGVIHYFRNEYGWLHVTQNTGTGLKEWKGQLTEKGLEVLAFKLGAIDFMPLYKADFIKMPPEISKKISGLFNIEWCFPGYGGEAFLYDLNQNKITFKGTDKLTFIGKPVGDEEENDWVSYLKNGQIQAILYNL